MLTPALAALLVAPSLAAMVLVWRGSSRPIRLIVWVALALCTTWTTLLVVSGANASIGSAPGPLGSLLSWTLVGTSALLALLASWLVVIWFAPLRRPLEDGPPARAATCLILLSAVLSALTVDDLLVRVISLDLGSLLVCALLLFSVAPSARLAAIWSYALLFLGDLAFLAMALLLHASAGTWNVDAALYQANAAAPGIRWAILITGLLAVWAKLALPPLGGWLRAFEHRQGLAATLVASAGPPLLGAYLLYRLQPLAQAMGWPATRFLLGATALSGALLVWRWIKDRDGWTTAQGIHALLGVILALTPTYQVYLLCFVPLRAVLSLALQSAHQPAVTPPALNDGAPRTLIHSALGAVRKGAYRTQASAKGVPAVLARASAIAMQADARGHRALERAVLSVTGVAGWLSSHHGGKLRRSLLWAVLGLIPILLVLLKTSWEA
jgi:hypothetical protein